MLSDLIAHGHFVRMVDLPRGRLGFHAMAIGAGFEKRQNELYSWEGLKRGSSHFLLIQHTLAGRGELDFAGARYILEPGMTMVLSAPHRHRYWLDRGRSWEYFWIGVNGSEALRIGRSVLDLHGPVIRLAPQAIDRIADACRLIMDEDGLTVGAASSAAYAAVTALYDGMVLGKASADAELPPAIQRAKALIDADVAAPLGVDRLAAVARLSRAHFVRVFTTALGVSPSSYVQDRRLDRAARLLHATDLPVSDIAAATGFASANYFAKAFRRHHGVSPSDFRTVRDGPAL